MDRHSDFEVDFQREGGLERCFWRQQETRIDREAKRERHSETEGDLGRQGVLERYSGRQQ